MVWHFEPTKRISTYITALVAGEYHEVPDTYERHARRDPARHLCRKSLVQHFDADDIFEVTKQGFEFFEDAVRLPYPFGKYDQVFVPEYNLGAMENAGCVTFRDEYIFRSRQDPRVLRAPGQHDPARDGAHVVRRPRDDEVVGRPVAERVLRRVGRATTPPPTPRSTTEAWTTFANARKTWATARTSCPRPTRSPPTTTTSRPSR